MLAQCMIGFCGRKSRSRDSELEIARFEHPAPGDRESLRCERRGVPLVLAHSASVLFVVPPSISALASQRAVCVCVCVCVVCVLCVCVCVCCACVCMCV